MFTVQNLFRVDLFKDSLALLLPLSGADLLPIDAHFQTRHIFNYLHLISDQSYSCPNLGTPSAQIVTTFFNS